MESLQLLSAWEIMELGKNKCLRTKTKPEHSGMLGYKETSQIVSILFKSFTSTSQVKLILKSVRTT